MLMIALTCMQSPDWGPEHDFTAESGLQSPEDAGAWAGQEGWGAGRCICRSPLMGSQNQKGRMYALRVSYVCVPVCCALAVCVCLAVCVLQMYVHVFLFALGACICVYA